MAHDQLVTLASYPNAAVASIVRSHLEEEGIRTYLDGETASTMMSHVGTALGGVRLMVASHDLERAVALLQDELGERPQGLWACGECGETVEPDFDVCWMCGADRPEQPEVVERKSLNEEEWERIDGGRLGDAESNLETTDTDTDESDETAVGDDLAERAWRASLLGIVFLPLTIYAGWLVAKAGSHDLGSRGWRHFLGAILAIIVSPFTQFLLVSQFLLP